MTDTLQPSLCLNALLRLHVRLAARSIAHRALAARSVAYHAALSCSLSFAPSLSFVARRTFVSSCDAAVPLCCAVVLFCSVCCCSVLFCVLCCSDLSACICSVVLVFSVRSLCVRAVGKELLPCRSLRHRAVVSRARHCAFDRRFSGVVWEAMVRLRPRTLIMWLEGKGWSPTCQLARACVLKNTGPLRCSCLIVCVVALLHSAS